MSTDKFDLFEVFARTAENGSFSQAAKELGVEPSTISRKIKKLEKHIKQSLIQRDSHEFALTETGHRFLSEATDLLNRWHRMEDRYRGAEQSMSGALKVIAPIGLGQHVLTESTVEFQKLYPEMRLTWILRDESVKFSETGCDLWIRLGDHDDSSLDCRKLAITQRTLVAAPELVRSKSIKNAACVEKLPCVALDPIDGGQIQLTSMKSQQARYIYPDVVLSTNNFFAMHTSIINGLGFGVLPHWYVNDDLQTGRLTKILPEWQPRSLSINAVFLPERYRSIRIGTFVEHISSTLKATPGIRVFSQKKVMSIR
ncbi:LysR family transcriptional regulator [Granulosicoccus sp. 3-233]|uniref:LysR family transcriptional regulator n=1 Tax=Granulosicoccus sp. 3-233 TaxID=3417969 RepID=UPI003D3576D8